MKNESLAKSIPANKAVRGYEIKRMPIGRFLQAAELLQEMPEMLMKAVFPQASAESSLLMLKNMTRGKLEALILRALAVLPGQAVALFAQLSDIPEKELLENPAIGLDGLAELMMAWMEVNGIENFMQTAGALATRVRGLKAAAGSNG